MKNLTLTAVDKRRLNRSLKTDGHPQFDLEWLRMDCINVLPQVRTLFYKEPLEVLATDIASKGLVNMINVMFYEKEMAELHVKTLNTIHGAKHSFDNLKLCRWKGKDGYFILIAGERRYRGQKILVEKGCLRCRNERAAEIAKEGAFNACYRRHFIHNQEPLIHCKVMSEISPLRALSIQLSENLYEKPKPYEEAKVYTGFYKLLKLINPLYDIYKFARRVVRRPATLLPMIGYCDLPIKIQEYVENGYIRYGIAKQLVRLRSGLMKLGREKEYIDKKIETYFLKAVIDGHKVGPFTKMVTHFLREEEGGQPQLFDLMVENATIGRPKMGPLVDKNLQRSLRTEVGFNQRIESLLRDGFLTDKDGMLKTGDVQRLLVTLCVSNEGLLGEFADKLDPETLASVQNLAKEAKSLGLVA